MKDADPPLAGLLAKSIAALCVRNTFLEELHSGTPRSSISVPASSMWMAIRSAGMPSSTPGSRPCAGVGEWISALPGPTRSASANLPPVAGGPA
jgi:hypothetical protein